MKTLAILINLFLPINESDTVYKQDLQIMHHSPFKPYAKGVLYIENDSLFFVAKKEKKAFLDFAVALREIEKVKNEWLYLFPNRLSIITEKKKYLLFTYKRRRLRKAILSSMGK